MKNDEIGVLATLVNVGAGYFWFLVLAAWGGAVNYIRRVKKDNLRFSIFELVGELSVSAFAGIVTALVCQEMNVSVLLTYAAVAISGHLGGKTIDAFENKFLSRIDKQ